jgi:hypothetical protein
MKQFDRTACRLLSAEIEAALQPLAAKHEIKIKCASGTFTAGNYRLKIECAVEVNGQVMTHEVEDFKRYARHFGLEPSDLGKTITHLGEAYRVEGLKPKSHRFPVTATRLRDGKRYKIPASAVRPLFANVPVPPPPLIPMHLDQGEGRETNREEQSHATEGNIKRDHASHPAAKQAAG